jgi:hypothetical protein
MSIRGLFLASSERMKRLSFKKLIIVPPILTYFLDLYHTNRIGTSISPFSSAAVVLQDLMVKREYAFSPNFSRI